MVEKRKFYTVEIPLLSEEEELIGESLESLNNRSIKLDLTRVLKGKSIEVVFKVKADSKKAIAEPKKLILMGFFIRRMIRKGTDYVEDSFDSECKNALLRVKPFLIARKKVHNAVKKKLREEAKSELIEYFKDKNLEDIFSDIISNKLQKTLSLKLKKIYPLALCEIRVLEVKKAK